MDTIYKIGKEANAQTKVNIAYSREQMVNYICLLEVAELLKELELDTKQKIKLNKIMVNLYWT